MSHRKRSAARRLCPAPVLALALAMLTAAANAPAANNHPVVLVHGFLGFGPDQYQDSGFLYWGGFGDIAAHLRSYNGTHAVWAAGVGAISSNWDRAAELYYQIKGGCVDYGSAHTARFVQFGAQQRPSGKCWAADPANNPEAYPAALYPAWDATHPIHLIGHSQGGQTIRALIELLENGSPHGNEGGGELYQGGKLGWVLSATTISAPHNGTSLRDALLDFGPRMAQLSAYMATLANGGRAGSAAAREPREDAPLWDPANNNSAQWEMAPDGAREFNGWARTSPRVYYFSVSNGATEQGTVCCNNTDRAIAPVQNGAYQYARRDMMVFTKSWAGEWIVPSRRRHGMGAYTQSQADRVPVDSSWFRNDGMVNTVSMQAPFGHPLRSYDGSAVRGSWNHLHYYGGYDHFDMIGWPGGPSPLPLYETISNIIFGL